jgi:predicted nucleic acid-binding protein
VNPIFDAALEVQQICVEEGRSFCSFGAIAGDAELIVTGDEDPLALGTYRDVAILTPRQFLERP